MSCKPVPGPPSPGPPSFVRCPSMLLLLVLHQGIASIRVERRYQEGSTFASYFRAETPDASLLKVNITGVPNCKPSINIGAEIDFKFTGQIGEPDLRTPAPHPPQSLPCHLPPSQTPHLLRVSDTSAFTVPATAQCSQPLSVQGN